MRKPLGFAIILAAVLLAAPPAASAQSAVIAGSLGNFDIVNNTGHEAHGFEIELEGLQIQDVPYSFGVQRYGAAEIVPSPTGVYVRWKSGYDAGTGQFAATTIVRPAGTAFVPAPGKQFVNWSGGPCDKSAVAVCPVLITRDTSIQPNFTK